MKKFSLWMILGVLAMTMNVRGEDSAAADCSAAPEPGKQVLQSMEVPASQDFWNTGKVDQLGEYKPADNTKKETLYYWLFLPTDESAKTDQGFPLLIFLHGAGERGPNPNNVKCHGPAKLVETEKGASWPFITLSPQVPDGGYWSPDQLLLLLDKIIAENNVDTSRIYVTGLSMGGYGTWMLLDIAGDRFAAAAPLCGGCDPAKAGKMLDIPVWIFHGDADSAVPVDRSLAMEKAIRDLGGKKVKMTIYPGCDHDCWTETYNNPELYKWFLEQNLDARNK